MWISEAFGDAGHRLAPGRDALIWQIVLRGIHKDFPGGMGGSLAVLRDVTVTVGEGEFCCVVGYSGCGKSTILNIVAGLTLPDSGQVLVDDARVDSSRIRIGYVFQKPRLLNWKSVRENVAFALRTSGVPAAEARARALHYLDLVGLAQFEDEFPLALSGGMQQRVAIARARSEEHTSELQSHLNLVCRLLLEKKKKLILLRV